jgi:hypothetical protein
MSNLDRLDRLERLFDASAKYDIAFETRKWVKEIPYINFPSDVSVKVIPAFGGAVTRFLVKKGNKTVSAYLDCYSMLGAMHEPYWEIYPYYSDTFRCYLHETDLLLEKILEELNRDDFELSHEEDFDD